ncbi:MULTISPECIES: nuclear transport factor 2 family protein [unclassified Flavobacterium]|uniref:nuclear transport factor 2 family protein n=1 Tax=unclassified Flavobacterium TaxID=196869 RepID=UPI001F13FB9E|nr:MULTISPECIES: nuclear transport factor 2 family protein [unclassified Flavobacterium]UMY64934.1 nuclear transport factor 2 family protein [Flavobacterium sp. HJ-32-4]
MPKTHVHLVKEAEERLLCAFIAGDADAIRNMVAPNITVVSAYGEFFLGVDNIPMSHVGVMRVHTIKVLQQHVTDYTSVVIVNTLEERKGVYRDIEFGSRMRTTRVWRFDGRAWRIVHGHIVQAE